MKYLVLLLLLTSCTFKLDNDLLVPSHASDKSYTNGFEFSTLPSPDDSGSHNYSFGQVFYTPEHKQVKEYLPNERPYAAFLYGKYGQTYRRNVNTYDRAEFTAGIVGPRALGGETQNTVHRIVGDRTAKGWNNQIHDEPGIILTGERTLYYGGGKSDLKTTVGGNLGNVFTQGYISSTARFGMDLHDGNNNGPIFPRIPREESKLSYYILTGVLGRAVARNIFLDGNTFRSSASIDKEPLVGEYRLGFGVEKGNYKFQYFYIVQGKEFDGDSGQRFGEIQITTGW